MKRAFFILLMISISTVSQGTENLPATIAEGKQPQLSIDTKGIVRIAFGFENKIYCSTSSDKGVTFSKPAFVAEVPTMHLGMTRGPQIASSVNYSIISAIDKVGKIYSFKLDHASKKWTKIELINDAKDSAPEALMSITADNKDNFYAVWLDTRMMEKNNIYFSSLSGKETHWKKNILAYKGPEGNVCECCKPSIAAKGSLITIMFRNWVNGSRDLYLLKSANQGKSFSTAQKLGLGTWKLKGCPMDGGGVAIDNSGNIHTAWKREGSVFYSKPGEKEREISTGRGVSITTTGNKPLIIYQDNGVVSLVSLDNQKLFTSKGSALKSLVLQDNKILCVWEEDSKIRFKKI